MLSKGGIPYYQSLAEERSKLIYDIIDRSAGFYTNEVDPRFRSRVNLPFRVLKNQPLEAKFLEGASQLGLIALGGYKGIGCRASMYNAMPIEGAEALARFMRQFMDENHRKVCYTQGKL
jgi:phosphoserine aminotransferase